MGNTFNRQPFSVPVGYSEKTGMFMHAEFKGICDNLNNVTVDQLTFADAKNIYLNENNILSSRPAFKFYDGDAYIVEQWVFGIYNLRLYRISTDSYYTFIIRCVSHKDANNDNIEYGWKIKKSVIGDDYAPKVTCAQIEDKIFIWFAGIDFIDFNTSTLSFEDAAKYLYLPIHKLIINGIENDLETKNFLTQTYRKRHQYSTVSSVNFEKLIGREMSVGLNGNMTKNKSKHLYDITVGENQDKMLIYPYSPIGSNYYIDIVQTPRSIVVLRYSVTFGTIEVSFDGKSYRALPALDGIVGTPLLTKDGLWAVAFTTAGLAKCKLVAQESTDFSDEFTFGWIIDKYMRNIFINGNSGSLNTLDVSFTPSGYFETIDNFAYVFSGASIVSGITGNIQYVYTEWLSASNDVVAGYYPLRTFGGNNGTNLFPNDDIKVCSKYVAPVAEYPDMGILIAIMMSGYNEFIDIGNISTRKGGLLSIYFKLDTENMNTPNTNGAKIDFVNYDSIKTTQPVDIIDNGIRSRYIQQEYAYPCRQMDFVISTPIIDTSYGLKYTVTTGYNVIGDRTFVSTLTYAKNDIVAYEGKLYKYINNVSSSNHLPTDISYWEKINDTAYDIICNIDCLRKYNCTPYNEMTGTVERPISLLPGISNSYWFKIMQNADAVLTDKYLWIGNEVMYLPQNGLLEPIVTDYKRNIVSNDEVILTLQSTVHDKNIHKLTENGVSLETGTIKSGDTVSYTVDAINEEDYLQIDSDGKSNRFVIEKLIADGTNWIVDTGYIKFGDFIRLKSYDEYISLPVGNPGNPGNTTLTIMPYNYPNAPSGWTVGDDWPSAWPDYKPVYPNVDGTLRFWKPGDALPTGPICIYGTVSIAKRIMPLNIDTNGVWYNIDGALWTSQLSTDNIIELDEYIDADKIYDTLFVDLLPEVPEHFMALNEYCFSFTTKEGYNLLQMTSTRRDEDKIFTNNATDFLLYLSKTNEQRFANKITNIHPLSENTIGVFTNDEIWYVQSVSLSDGTPAYTKPTKSKIPVGCKDGNDIITALNGKALIFPTARGLAAMAPEDFIATAENTLTYLSDVIQEKYYKFYERPMLKLITYKYWLLMYRYMDREIFVFDTRTSTWWIWETPYLIKSINVDLKLRVMMQLDIKSAASLLGVSFVAVDSYKYYDDVVSNSLSGTSKLVYENASVGNRLVVEYASPIINWYFTSQKLHFNQINNYKGIYGINTNLIGTDSITAKLSTKVYRDKYHPESDVTMEIDINDLRTFVKRLNLMHVMNFQYKFENDNTIDKSLQKPLRLNSICVKYGVKEGIR